jgi:hypothetical protein
MNMVDCVASWTEQGVGPYLCEVSRVEVIWAQVEDYVPTQNKSFKVAVVKTSCNNQNGQITAERVGEFCSACRKQKNHDTEISIYWKVDENVTECDENSDVNRPTACCDSGFKSCPACALSSHSVLSASVFTVPFPGVAQFYKSLPSVDNSILFYNPALQ